MDGLQLDHLPRRSFGRAEGAAPAAGGNEPRTMDQTPAERPDPALQLLEPLLKQGEAGPSSWNVKQVGEVRKQLGEAIRSNKTRNLALVTAHFADISSQVRSAEHLGADYGRVEVSVQGLEAQMDHTSAETSFLPPALDQLSTHFRHVSRREQARGHLEMLKTVREETGRLRMLEEAVWTGRGGQREILDGLIEIQPLESGAGGAAGGGMSSRGMLRGTRIHADIVARKAALRDIVRYQLERALAKLVTIASEPEASITIRKLITFPEPNAPRPDRYPRPAPTTLPDYSWPDLLYALQRFGLLDPHLDALLQHITTFIIPAVFQQQKTHISLTSSNHSDALLCSTETKRDHADPREYVGDAMYLILYTEKYLLVASDKHPEALQRSLIARKTELYRLLLSTMLQSVLIPAVPSSIAAIQSWLGLLEHARQITTNTLEDRAPYAQGYSILTGITLLDDFVLHQAGSTYAEHRLQAMLDAVKSLVLGGWGGWDAMEVQQERDEVRVVLVEEDIEDHAGTAVPAPETVQPAAYEGAMEEDADGWGLDEELAGPSSSPKASKIAAASQPQPAQADEAGDGWGFDDDVVPAPTSSRPDGLKSGTATGASVPTGDMDMDQGWDFDLAAAADKPLSPSATTPASAAPAPKPKAREAKKLGKRIGQKKAKLAAQEADHSGSEDVDMSSSGYSDRSAVSRVAPSGSGPGSTSVRETTQGDGWGWGDDEPSPSKASSKVPPPAPASLPPAQPPLPKRTQTVVKEQKVTFIDTYLVSKSCQSLTDLVKQCLSEAAALHTSHADLDLPVQFAENAYSLITAASSVLTLFRALIFASPHVADVPTLGMQLSNDCAWIADHLPLQTSGTPTVDGEQAGYTIGGIGEGGGPPDLPRWDRDAAVSLMRSASVHAYESQLATQREGIMRVLEDMPEFGDLGEEANHKAGLRVVGEVKDTIDSLGRVWKLVLPRPQYLAALGHLVDIALLHLITSVLALLDIPQVESDHLVEILTELKQVESMGIFDAQPSTGAEASENTMPVSSIATYVPHWLKYVYLIELLGASLLDIGQLLDHGALVDFEKEELVRLIRALFAESEVREGVVSRIEASA